MSDKLCTKYGDPLTTDNCTIKKGRPGQNPIFKSRCKRCTNEIYRSRWNKYKHPQKRRESNAQTKRCVDCNSDLALVGNFHPCCKEPTKAWHYDTRCKICAAERQKQLKRSGYKRPCQTDLAYRLISPKYGRNKPAKRILSLGTAEVNSIIAIQSSSGHLRCAATGAILSTNWQHPLRPSLDRINTSIGDTLDNTRIVSYFFNLARSCWQDEDVMITLCGNASHQADKYDYLAALLKRLRTRNKHQKKFNCSLKDGDYLRLLDNAYSDGTVICMATGSQLTPESLQPNSLSLDRIDSKKDYTLDNIQITALAYNLAKEYWPNMAALEALQEVKNAYGRQSSIEVAS